MPHSQQLFTPHAGPRAHTGTRTDRDDSASRDRHPSAARSWHRLVYGGFHAGALVTYLLDGGGDAGATELGVADQTPCRVTAGGVANGVEDEAAAAACCPARAADGPWPAGNVRAVVVELLDEGGAPLAGAGAARVLLVLVLVRGEGHSRWTAVVSDMCEEGGVDQLDVAPGEGVPVGVFDGSPTGGGPRFGGVGSALLVVGVVLAFDVRAVGEGVGADGAWAAT